MADAGGGYESLRRGRGQGCRGAKGVETGSVAGIDGIRVVGTEAKFDESPRIGSDLGLPALIGLEFEHRGLGVAVPFGTRLAAQIMLPDERLLNSCNTLRINGLLTMHLVACGWGMVLGVRMSTRRSAVNSGRHGGGCRKTGG